MAFTRAALSRIFGGLAVHTTHPARRGGLRGLAYLDWMIEAHRSTHILSSLPKTVLMKLSGCFRSFSSCLYSERRSSSGRSSQSSLRYLFPFTFTHPIAPRSRLLIGYCSVSVLG